MQDNLFIHSEKFLILLFFHILPLIPTKYIITSIQEWIPFWRAQFVSSVHVLLAINQAD